MIVFAAIMPHPPISIPGIGKLKDLEMIDKTLRAFEELRVGLEKSHPETIIIISPHGKIDPYSFVINSSAELTGGFESFGLDQAFTFKNDIEFVDKLGYMCPLNEIPTKLESTFLDHGALIPLYHLTKNIKPNIVHLSFSLMSYERHHRYGELISSVINSTGRRVAIIASGDLSHRLTPSSPAGFSSLARKFDQDVVHFLGQKDLPSILGLHEDIAREAAECGIRSIMILLGALSGKEHDFKLLSYEGPFGVGYLTARLI